MSDPRASRPVMSMDPERARRSREHEKARVALVDMYDNRIGRREGRKHGDLNRSVTTRAGRWFHFTKGFRGGKAAQIKP